MRGIPWFLLSTVSVTTAFVFFSPGKLSRTAENLSSNPISWMNRNDPTRTRAARRTNDPSSSASFDEECDVLIVGSGPAARAMATLLSAPGESQLNVIMADANYDVDWVPNYGVWRDEWDSVVDRYSKEYQTSLTESCIDREWAVTDCYFGGSFDIPVKERFRIPRPYCRVDKNALRDALSPSTYRVLRANHVVSEAIGINMYAPAGSLVHDKHGSTVKLQSKDGSTMSVRAKLVVDCTGHETKLVLKDPRSGDNPPGFQIAYGFLVDVDESSSPDLAQIGPYDKEAMTLFDYRTDHFVDESLEWSKAQTAPTFMYAMPLKDNKIFFEETSLVARPAVSFQECKERCLTRLAHHNIKVTSIEEEEFCYIPMGGPLPAKDQRVIGFGGAAAMVHPSTGYHLCRALMGATDMARTIRRELSMAEVNLDRAAGAAYHSIWAPSNIMQRNFAIFGGEFLMKQNVKGLRGFFDGFFRLPLELWGGFLAGWPGLPNNENHETWLARLWYGVTFVSKLPPQVAADMLLSIAIYSVTMKGFPLPQCVTPFLGQPESYEYSERSGIVGDVAAKMEAKKMIDESKVTKELPVAFEADEDTTA